LKEEQIKGFFPNRQKKGYDKGWHKRDSDCLKAMKKIKQTTDKLSEEID